MRYVILLLTIFVLTHSVKSQAPSWNGQQFTINWQNPLVMRVNDTFNLKELAYLKYDSVTNTKVTRGNQNYVYFGLWHEYLLYYELATAADAVAEQINDDGTVKNWPLLSDALDRYKIVKLKYWRRFPINCNCQ